MRVLTVANSFPPVGYMGGAEVSNYHTCRGLIQGGVDCSVLVLNNRVSEMVNVWYELDGILDLQGHKSGAESPQAGSCSCPQRVWGDVGSLPRLPDHGDSSSEHASRLVASLSEQHAVPDRWIVL